MSQKLNDPSTCLVVHPLAAREVWEDVVEDLELTRQEHLVEPLPHADHHHELQVHNHK